MESQGGNIAKEEFGEMTVDFSNQSLKRIDRANIEQQSASTLILDHNEIQKLDNLETYTNLEKLTAVNNQLIRMYGVSHLIHLVSLDLSNNMLVTIEGLKDLKELKYLNLAKNRIKSMEHLDNNIKLEKIDLSENHITRISDISFLENLKELSLQSNRIGHLLMCDKYLPSSLEVLTLNDNSLADLNEISYLVHLTFLKKLSIANNPCLKFPEHQKFNYRPFIKNWCTSVVVLDNSPLDDIECLKAEWLYSQGRGRSFRPGEQAALIEYLYSVCPREKEVNAETEDVKKLKLILSKAQLHQQQLREQLSTGKFSESEPGTSLTKKKMVQLSDRMVSSFQDCCSQDLKSNPQLMTQSLDSGMLKKSSKIYKPELCQTPLQTSTTFIPIPDTLISPDVGQSLASNHVAPSVSSRTSCSSRNSLHSTPESKRRTPSFGSRKPKDSSCRVNLKKNRAEQPHEKGGSPGKSPSSRNADRPGKKGTWSDRNCRETSEDDESEVLAFKMKAIQQRASQRKQIRVQPMDKTRRKVEAIKQLKQTNLKCLDDDARSEVKWKAAVCIQRWWRGYRARNLNGDVLKGCKNIQINRMQDYIAKVVTDMQATRVALEENRKLVVLQMQAINSLWKKMTALQPSISTEPNSGDSKVNLQNLMETCSNLNKQVEGLHAMMQAIKESSNSNSLIPMATQTEIIAVHTPQGETKEIFPYYPHLKPVEIWSSSPGGVEGKECGETLSNSDSALRVVKMVKELYTNSSLKDSEDNDSLLEEFLAPGDLTFSSEKLAKPSVKLNESSDSEFPPGSNELGNPSKVGEHQQAMCLAPSE